MRLDILVHAPDPWYIEAKSVTLVDQNGVALFPDAPTARGRRHLGLLRRLRRKGARCAVAFVIQRDDARAFRPNVARDPCFALELRRAAEEGILVLAFRCRVRRQEIAIEGEVPVTL